MKTQFRAKSAVICAAAGMAVTMSACSGGVAPTGGSGSSGSGEGFEYDADQSAVDELIADEEPVTLKYQPTAASPNSKAAPAIFGFKEAIEERSNGQITVEIIWGQAIASFAELDDALIDGRVDIGHVIPTYNPSEYPQFSNILSVSQFAPVSPVVGELATTAMVTELAMNDDKIIGEFTDQGLSVITPPLNGGDLYFMCNPNNPGAEVDAWEGRQTRVGSTLNEVVVESLGASPVSLEFVETFEGLQRNTVDCTLTPLTTAAETDAGTVAPNMTYKPETSIGGRSSSAQVVGTNVQQLPLAYQQIVFDAGTHFYNGWLQNITDSSLKAVTQSKENGGEIVPLPDEAAEAVEEGQLAALDEQIANGDLPEDIADSARESSEKWVNIAGELGFEDGGDLSSIDEWYSEGSIDYQPFTDRMMEDLLLPIRPE